MSALAHLNIVEYGNGIAAQFCARLFADLGAAVVKVEPPGGDPSRDLGPFPQDLPDREGSGLFHLLNAGKRSLVADLDQPGDLDVFHRLLDGADVLVESATPGERGRWNLGFDSLAQHHPHLVAVSVSPYGRSGPWAERAGTDLTVQAVSSLAVAIGWPDRSPLTLPFDQAAFQAGFHAAAAALCALHERAQSGRGQGIDIAAARVLAQQVGAMHLVVHKRGLPWMRCGNRLKGTLYPTAFFEASDGHVVIVTLHGRQWRRWIELMGSPPWSKEARSLDSYNLGLVGEDDPVDIAFRQWLKRFTRQQLIDIANANDLIVGPVNTVDQVLESPQFAFRDGWGHVRIGGVGVRIPKPGYLFAKTPVSIECSGPRLDADGANVRVNLPPPPRRANPPPPPRVDDRNRSGALHGLRVLDFGWNWAGPMAGQLLADMGAEVIRIETTLRQDNMRAFAYAADFFCQNNRSKLSATFNVADARGAELVRRLAATSDIVMDNFAAGVMAKNGLAYEDFVKVNPRIIVVSMSMAGQAGPERHLRGFASVSSAYIGLEAMVGYPEENRTTGFMAFGIGDTTQSIQAVIGALVALIHRNRSGQGQFVDMGQICSLCASLGEPLIDYQLNRRIAGLCGNRSAHYAPHGIYASDRGIRWVALAVRDQRDWQRLCRLMSREDWSRDASMQTLAARRIRGAEIDAAVRDWLYAQNRDDVVERLCAAGIPAAPVLELEERNGHAVFAAAPMMVSHQGSGFDPCSIYTTPWHLTATPPAIRRPTPAIGEHNDYVFRELLGLGEQEIAGLKDDKVLI